MPTRKSAPWPDFAGNPILEGDTIEHPNGERGVVVFIPNKSSAMPWSVDYEWRVNYGDGALSRLSLQISQQGRAIVTKTTDLPTTKGPTMKTYIGTKIIQAEPRAKNYGPVEQQGQPGYTVIYPDGYTSWSPAAAFEAAYIEIGEVGDMPAHQLRVRGELAQLDDNRRKLATFMDGEKFATLCDEAEQQRLREQYSAMTLYSAVLVKRIAAFTN